MYNWYCIICIQYAAYCSTQEGFMIRQSASYLTIGEFNAIIFSVGLDLHWIYMHMFSEDVLVHQNWSDKIILYFIVIWSQCFRGKVVALSICSIPNLTWKNTAWKYHAYFLGNAVFVKRWYHEIFRLPAESILGIASWQSNWFILIMYMLKCICRANKLYFRISNLNTRILSERDFVISETLIFWTYLEI